MVAIGNSELSPRQINTTRLVVHCFRRWLFLVASRRSCTEQITPNHEARVRVDRRIESRLLRLEKEAKENSE
ncbi:unnamed protein product [Rodentolepis nana]|uniref:Uncharacterized protein n=1 Tax=Rodentolepis nana TaxID=102285 RepID=A0A0R3U0K4_RODNA|nr:unnamed protein product [Rodentolepis nana]